MHVQDWLNLRTFHHGQFEPMDNLVAYKNARKTTISICLPTLNEAATIGKIIRILQREFMQKHPLVDEILVVDSGSTDGTVEVARKMGVAVFTAHEVLPELGPARGKGENLWKSLYLARGDILVWVDTDIVNFHPRFVSGLIGPLLTHPDIGFVKGFYRRPIKIGNKLQPTGGGRVTEILVKPFLNLFFPELAGFFQPLSGEYAGRRELLERLPFFTGYGVETGLMIDVADRFGLRPMAQVDLEVRVHRNQELAALRKMAFGILHVLLSRAEQKGKLLLLEPLSHTLLNIELTEFQRYRVNLQKVQELERPPMILVDAYQQKRGIGEEDLILLEEIQKTRAIPPLSIQNYLQPELIWLNGTARSRDEALRDISTRLAEMEIGVPRAKLFRELLKREESLSTGIGEGIAIPHARIPGLRQMVLAVYRSRSGVAFQAVDGAPVKLIFVVLAPPEENNTYLELLANLARLLRDPRIRRGLIQAPNRTTFVRMLKKAEVLKRFERELAALES
ncbi:MAG: glucosyl-3-phosphoglycerate synthase [Calditrichaeota bacterium]|nr:MAG: glucosyl-3-phosphoglycerate synthase [Calditrichota bacterium]